LTRKLGGNKGLVMLNVAASVRAAGWGGGLAPAAKTLARRRKASQ
jgi:hypothetical protein